MTRKILRMSLVEMTNILVRSKCFSRNKLFLELFIELRTLFYCFVFPFHLSFFWWNTISQTFMFIKSESFLSFRRPIQVYLSDVTVDAQKLFFVKIFGQALCTM